MQALLNIISNPVNSTVPIAVETLKQAGVYDPTKVFGVTQLDVVGHTLETIIRSTSFTYLLVFGQCISTWSLSNCKQGWSH